jgi:hypothetical protein
LGWIAGWLRPGQAQASLADLVSSDQRPGKSDTARLSQARGAALTSQLTSVGVGGILAILILRLVFDFLKNRRDGNGRGRLSTDKVKGIVKDVDSVLMRMDHIIDRLDNLTDATKAARKQSEIATEHTERMTRAVDQLQRSFNNFANRRNADTNPAIGG